MCNLYSHTSARQAVLDFTKAMTATPAVGNMPAQPGIYRDYTAPVVRNREGQRELAMCRWGMPSPAFALKGKKVDKGLTNIRKTNSNHWLRWLGVENRCVVPFTSFSEPGRNADGNSEPVWFALNKDRPLMFFAGVWTNWTSVRKVKEGEVNADLYGFLTTEPNDVVGAIHPKAMPVILQTPGEVETWLTAPWEDAGALQGALPDGVLEIVARGGATDG